MKEHFEICSIVKEKVASLIKKISGAQETRGVPIPKASDENLPKSKDNTGMQTQKPEGRATRGPFGME